MQNAPKIPTLAHTAFFYTGADAPGIRVVACVSKASLQLKFPNQPVTTVGTDPAFSTPPIPAPTPFSTPPIPEPEVMGAYTTSARVRTTQWNVSQKVNQIDITDYVTQISWTQGKEQNYTEATLGLDNRGQLFNWLPAGTLILIQARQPRWKAAGAFKTFLSLYMFESERTNEGGSETMNITCYDRLKWLASSKPGNHVYKKDKRHKRGWTSRQIITDICKRAKLPVGTLGLPNVYIKKIETTGDAMAQINAVIKHVQKETKEKNDLYRVHATNGKLNIEKTITDEKKIKTALYFDDQAGLENANVSVKPNEKFATQLKVIPSTKWRTEQWKKSKHKGKVPKSYLSKPIIVNPSDPNIQRVFGVITKEDKELGRKHNISRAGLIKLAKAELNKNMQFVQTASFTARGSLGLRPESWVFLASARLGVRGLFRVQSITYTLSRGNLVMSLTVDLSTKPRLDQKAVKGLMAHDPIRY